MYRGSTGSQQSRFNVGINHPCKPESRLVISLYWLLFSAVKLSSVAVSKRICVRAKLIRAKIIDSL